MAVLRVTASRRLVEVFDVSETLAASINRLITLMMVAASTSKTSVNYYQTTWRYNPEDSHLNPQSVFLP